MSLHYNLANLFIITHNDTITRPFLVADQMIYQPRIRRYVHREPNCTSPSDQTVCPPRISSFARSISCMNSRDEILSAPCPMDTICSRLSDVTTIMRSLAYLAEPDLMRFVRLSVSRSIYASAVSCSLVYTTVMPFIVILLPMPSVTLYASYTVLCHIP